MRLEKISAVSKRRSRMIGSAMELSRHHVGYACYHLLHCFLLLRSVRIQPLFPTPSEANTFLGSLDALFMIFYAGVAHGYLLSHMSNSIIAGSNILGMARRQVTC